MGGDSFHTQSHSHIPRGRTAISNWGRGKSQLLAILFFWPSGWALISVSVLLLIVYIWTYKWIQLEIQVHFNWQLILSSIWIYQWLECVCLLQIWVLSFKETMLTWVIDACFLRYLIMLYCQSVFEFWSLTLKCLLSLNFGDYFFIYILSF